MLTMSHSDRTSLRIKKGPVDSYDKGITHLKGISNFASSLPDWG